MFIEEGKQVTLNYILHVESPEGEIVEETNPEEPLQFVFGEDQMLPKFEEALRGLKAGDKFTVAIACADAYGPEDDEAYVEFPKSEFIAEGEWDDELFAVGEIIPMQTPEGETIHGIVDDVKLNTIVIDFNHPLAGEDLYFEGEIVEVA
jgi:FKBP-type peptidyl-prolyl cis-trans isomerase SlyD